MKQALIVVAKATIARAAPTHLHPRLTPQSAADLYISLLRDVLALARSLEGTDVALLYPRGSDGSASWLRQLASPNLRLLCQRGRSLVGGLAYACRTHIRLGYDKVVFTSPDTPTLPRRHLLEAFQRLNTHDVVVGPCMDGSYYLVGVRAFHPRLFLDVDWHTERALTQIVDRARALGLSVGILPSWYQVNDATDLERLVREAQSLHNGHAAHTRAFLNLWGGNQMVTGEQGERS